MGSFPIQIKRFGEHALLIEWPHEINETILDEIISFTPRIIAHFDSTLINHVSGYNSLLIQFENTVELESKYIEIKKMYDSHLPKEQKTAPMTWHIPVCYDEELGLDISLFKKNRLSSRDVIRLHTESPLRVYMIGFLPGFLYLGGLDEKLYMDRKATPRQQVPKGSVAIGGRQTGIYPMESPGGWQIIGRTPLTLFNMNRKVPTPIQQGDWIQFYPILKSTYDILSSH
ncbi:MAG: 5-oxoprolinase subunit PxpB [Saprospiraceae bacterium]|nr:5-oxoprolinase subunit PxpB [Saprospiraceae bacterium]